MENKNEPTIYKGFEIIPVFNYNNGRSDFNVFYPHAEYGYIAPDTNIESIKTDIDNYYESKLRMRRY